MAGTTTAPPSPWNARAAMSARGVVATPYSHTPNPAHSMATANGLRRPKRSRIQPAPTLPAMFATLNTLTIQPAKIVPDPRLAA